MYRRFSNLIGNGNTYLTWAYIGLQVGYGAYQIYDYCGRNYFNTTQQAPNAGGQVVEYVVRPRRRVARSTEHRNANHDSARENSRNEYHVCYICAETLDDPTRPTIRLSGCDHPFHKTCIDNFMIGEVGCPICNLEEGAALAHVAEEESVPDQQITSDNQDHNAQTIDDEIEPRENQTNQPHDEYVDLTREPTICSESTYLESNDLNNGVIIDQYNECFICAESLNDLTRPTATLPHCLHPFHKSCLDGLLRWRTRCPICDYDIFSPI